MVLGSAHSRFGLFEQKNGLDRFKCFTFLKKRLKWPVHRRREIFPWRFQFFEVLNGHN